MKRIINLLCLCVMMISLVGCAKEVKVPKADAGILDFETQSFGVDKNVNIETIDKYLNLDNVAYRDMRLLIDSSGYDAIGGAAMLTETIEGFRISPLPYIVNLWDKMLPEPVLNNPIEIDYTPLYTAVWNDDGSIASIKANYEESKYVLEEIFPKDKLLFLMCGGGGYAWMTKQLLIKLGYDETKIYNLGGAWGYKGSHGIKMISHYDKNNNGAYEGEYYSFFNGNYMAIDQTLKTLTKIGD